MVQRVETLTGGASSVYGADAVSGVVNFILRDGGDFDGIEVTAQTGVSDRWDSNEHYISVAGGFEFDGGRGEAVFAIEGQTNAEILETERGFAGPYVGNDIVNTPAIAAMNGVNPQATRAFVKPTTNPISTAQGVFNIADGDSFFGSVIPAVNGVRDGTGVPMIPGTNIPVAQVIDTPFNGIPRVYNPGVPANVNQAFGIGDGLQSLRQTVLPPQERYSVNFNGSYEVSEALNFLLNPSMRFQTTLRYRALTLTMAYPFVMTTLTYPRRFKSKSLI